ncbi:TPA: hypothetical protein HA278_05455, partial [Candidatus Woesearchaeota archaeon]|nr:hypothetical protein [Candidatus Woesearchaeota archaeon]
RVVLLAFERCSKTDKPKNVTQCLEFICRMHDELVAKGLTVNKEELRSLAGEYKDTYDRKILQDVMWGLQ